MRTRIIIRSLLFSVFLLAFCHGAFGQIGISVGFGPPLLPVYEQPILPGDGYLWAPGYWGYDNSANDYYWVPGTWVYPPQSGFLWTPGYWGWGGSGYYFNQGYWGPTVGYYGGINYGYGYGGVGYEGGRWEGNRFIYNTSVNRVDTAVVHSTYSAPVSNASVNRVSYNGGSGGVEARPTPQQESYAKEQHVGPVAAQTQQVQAARNNPELRASVNQGKPPIAATAKPGDFTTGFVAAKQAGGEYKASLPNAPSANVSHVDTINHASELPSHDFKAPNTGNAATNKSFQQQLNELSTRQSQDHETLEQQQEEEHQQATQKNYSDAQIQQMEQRHSQQTQQLEQQHASQNKQMEQRQSSQSSQSSSKQQSNSNSGKPH